MRSQPLLRHDRKCHLRDVIGVVFVRVKIKSGQESINISTET